VSPRYAGTPQSSFYSNDRAPGKERAASELVGLRHDASGLALPQDLHHSQFLAFGLFFLYSF
jgi:hypothetical protein